VPTWESLDSRPLPGWFDEAKIGIFIHWGVFSVPAKGAWFWYYWQHDRRPDFVNYMAQNYPPKFTYQDFGHQFTAEFFEPSKWAELFVKAGAKYVVLTSKHVEGFTLWPSKYSFGWNSVDIGPKRDLVGDLEKEIRTNTTLKFGLYHCLYEWFNPLYLYDWKNKLTTDLFPTQKTMPELVELVENYKPDLIWSDGGWDCPDEYWKSREFLTWLYNDSPIKDTIVTNDRWGSGSMCHHGGYLTCRDRYNPKVLVKRKWENCMTTDRDWWAFRRESEIHDFLSPEEIIRTVIETVSCGGNVLINVGPTKEGIIVPIQQERLLQLGEWLGINGQGIYGTVPWTSQNDTLTQGVWYTTRPAEKKVYAFMTKWPGSRIRLGSVAANDVQAVELFGTPGRQKWTYDSNPGIVVKMPALEATTSRWAWTLVITLK